MDTEGVTNRELLGILLAGAHQGPRLSWTGGTYPCLAQQTASYLYSYLARGATGTAQLTLEKTNVILAATDCLL